jgi:hypothetical protein
VQAQDDSTALSVFPGPDEGRPNNPCPAPDPTGEHAGIEYAGLPLVLRNVASFAILISLPHVQHSEGAAAASRIDRVQRTGAPISKRTELSP